MIHPVEYIQWQDHWSQQTSGWIPKERIHAKPIICHSVGFVIEEDKDGVLLALTSDGDVGPDELHSCVKYIIKKCIVKRKKLK